MVRTQNLILSFYLFDYSPNLFIHDSTPPVSRSLPPLSMLSSTFESASAPPCWSVVVVGLAVTTMKEEAVLGGVGVELRRSMSSMMLLTSL